MRAKNGINISPIRWPTSNKSYPREILVFAVTVDVFELPTASLTLVKTANIQRTESSYCMPSVGVGRKVQTTVAVWAKRNSAVDRVAPVFGKSDHVVHCKIFVIAVWIAGLPLSMLRGTVRRLPEIGRRPPTTLVLGQQVRPGGVLDHARPPRKPGACRVARRGSRSWSRTVRSSTSGDRKHHVPRSRSALDNLGASRWPCSRRHVSFSSPSRFPPP